MRFAVLGPLEVTAAGEIVDLGGRRQRRLLAALLFHVDQTVHADRLADIVFEGRPTAAATTTLRSYIARLRRVLPDDGSGTVIVTAPPGYALALAGSTIDAIRFEDGLREAQRMDPTDAAGRLGTLDEALAEWRGAAYAEFADEEWVHAEALRLEELRLTAEELRFGAQIDAGEHAAAAPGLLRFVTEHPLREAGRLSAMVALYRSGRQADALRTGDSYRTSLAELGLEPGAAFLELEERIVVQDAGLLGGPSPELKGYRIVGEATRGRHGTAHRAIQPGLEREVVVESFGPDLADHPEFIRRFGALVRRVARFEHRHVVPIFDFWRQPGSAHLVTRSLSGGSVLTLIEDKGPLPVERAASIVEAAASAIGAAHEEGLAHGALTPHDVILDGEGVAHVRGIELDRALDSIAAMIPDDRYGPPGGGEPAAARDQFALAALAYHVLAGLPPLPDRSGAGFPRLSQIRPELLALDGVLARAGAPDPSDRYPDVPTFLDSFATAIGRMRESARRTDRPATNPFKGLRPFVEEDTADFHGREAAVDLLLALMAANSAPALVTLVGASGSGKSSVVRAGLVPRLREGALPGSGDWFVITMVPGRSPFVELASAIAEIAAGNTSGMIDPLRNGIDATLDRVLPPGSHVLLVIDQLEELFTQVADDAVRRGFVARLAEAVAAPDRRLRVVATLRADFYDRPLEDPVLGDLVASGTVPLVAMSPADIEEVIVAPAERVGVAIDRSLAAEIVATTTDHPGALPLLQYCLTEMFDRRRGDTITLDDYRALGGLTGAVSERAGHIHDSASPAEQECARRMFLRLVSHGDIDDVRHRVRRREVLQLSGDAAAMNRVVDRFGEARLLTFDRDPETREPTVEIAHEALIRSWPRLQGWIDEEGAGLAIRAGLTAATRSWHEGGCDPGDLYSGSRLGVVEEWAEIHRDQITASEQEFLTQSIAARDEVLAAQRSMNRRLRRLLLAASVLVVVALVAGLVAVGQRNRAQDQTGAVQSARSAALAAAATDAVTEDRSRALLLAVEANRLEDSAATRRSLIASLFGNSGPTRTVIPTPAPEYSALAAAADGSIAVGKRADGSIDIVDLVTRSVRHLDLPGPPAPVHGVDLHPTGAMVVTSGIGQGGAAVIVYDTVTGGELVAFPGMPDHIYWARFSPEGDHLAVADGRGEIQVYRVGDWTVHEVLDTGSGQQLSTLSYGESGDVLATATLPVGGPEVLYLFDLGEGSVISREVDTGFAEAVSSIVAVPGADELVMVGMQLQRFAMQDLEAVGAPFGESGVPGLVSLAVAPDGTVVAGSPVELQLFSRFDDAGTAGMVTSIEDGFPGVAFADDGSTMVTADGAGSISVWSLGPVDDIGALLEPPGPGHVSLSPDGSVLAVWGAGRGVQFHDRDTLDHAGALDLGPEHSLTGLAFNPDGSQVATLTCPRDTGEYCPASLSVWDVDTYRRIAGPVDAGEVWSFTENGAAFARGGTVVATVGGRGENVHLWEAGSLDPLPHPLVLSDVAPLPGETRMVAAAEIDGRSLVVAMGAVGVSVVWDVTPAEATPVGWIENAVRIGFTPDGLLITSGGRGPFVFRDPSTLEPVTDLFAATVPPTSFSFSENGLLVTSGSHGSEMWDIATGRSLSGVIPSPRAAISPDGSTLYSGAAGGDPLGHEVRVASLATEDLREEACRRAGRNLTPQEWTDLMGAAEPRRSTCPAWPLPD